MSLFQYKKTEFIVCNIIILEYLMFLKWTVGEAAKSLRIFLHKNKYFTLSLNFHNFLWCIPLSFYTTIFYNLKHSLKSGGVVCSVPVAILLLLFNQNHHLFSWRFILEKWVVWNIRVPWCNVRLLFLYISSQRCSYTFAYHVCFSMYHMTPW